MDCNPHFKEFTASERRLCKNQDHTPFEIKFYDYSDLGNHTYLGSSLITLADI